MINVGDKVEYLGCIPEQVKWGNNDWPPCIIGNVYEVSSVRIHSQHTKIQLKGIVGQFNSVCFNVIS